VGDSLSLSYVEQPDANDAVFDTPSGKTVTVPVREYENQFVAMLEDADEAGFYEARVSVQAPGMPVAVNVDPRESEVTSLTAGELGKNIEGLGLTIATNETDLAAAIEDGRTGRSSWRQFMIAALVLLLAESLLADWLRNRKASRTRKPAAMRDNTASPSNV
jgi:hypothetical protein